MKKTLFLVALLVPFYLNATIFFNSNTTISTSTTYSDEVIVADNVVLTITGTNTIVSFQKDLTINAGATLIVNNATIKASERIFLHNSTTINQLGAQLLANSATFTAIADRWRGIEAWGDEVADRCAKVKFTNSTLEKAFIGIASYNYTGPFEPLDENGNVHFPIPGWGDFSPNIQYKEKRGGIIQTKNSTFQNNNTHIDLIGRESMDIVNSIPVNGHSYFNTTSFLLELPAYPFTSTPTELYPFIKITDISGVSILGCTFKDDFVHFSSGIWSINSDIRITRGNGVLGSWGNLTFEGPIKTTFNGQGNGVFARNNGTFKRTIVENSEFENFKYFGMDFNNSQYPYIIGNGLKFCNYASISLNFSTGYEVSQNTITQNFNLGIDVNESGEDYNIIYNNNLIDCGASLHAQGKNRSGFSDGSGLKFICNDMSKNQIDTTWDIEIVPNEIGDGISPYQGHVLFTLPYQENNIVETWSAGNKFYIPKALKSTPKNIYKEYGAMNSTYLYGANSINEYPEQRNISVLLADYDYSCPILYSRINGIRPANYTEFLTTLPKIESGISTLLSKEELTSLDSMVLESHFAKQKQLVNQLIQGYMYADDSLIHYDSIALVLSQIQYGWNYKVQLAQILATQHKYEDARSTLAMIPLSYSLSLVNQKDLENMSDMYEILEFLWLNDDQWSLVSNEMKDKVDLIIAAGEGNYGFPIALYFQNRYMDIPYSDSGFNASNNEFKTNGNFKTNDETNDFKGGFINKDFKISPNPVLNTLMVEWITELKDQSALISFYNLSGELMFKKNISADKNEINLSSLNPGVYLIQIRQNGKTIHQQKLIKK